MDANGIRSYIAAAKSYLSERQVTAHLNWSIPCQKYTLQEWNTFKTTGKTLFTLAWKDKDASANRKVDPMFKYVNVSLCI